jgi:hypothetical protein
MLDVALRLMEGGLSVAAGEVVLIVTDEQTDTVLRDACWEAAVALGARPHLVSYRNPDPLPQASLGYFPRAALADPDRMPAVVVAAGELADAVVMLDSDLSTLVEQTGFAQMAARSRVALLPYMPHQRARRLLPTSAEEYAAIAREGGAIAAALGEATSARLSSPGGTDLHMTLGHYAPRVHTSIARCGAPALLPGGQTTIIPDPASMRGLLVVDRSIADDDYRELRSPIELTIEAGRVVGFDGGVQARRLQRLLEQQDDPGVFHVTELGVGSNGRCTRTAVGAPTEDTHARGAVSLALGCDTHIGGVTQAPMHIDMTIWHPTLHTDRAPIVDAGELCLERTSGGDPLSNEQDDRRDAHGIR